MLAPALPYMPHGVQHISPICCTPCSSIMARCCTWCSTGDARLVLIKVSSSTPNILLFTMFNNLSTGALSSHTCPMNICSCTCPRGWLGTKKPIRMSKKTSNWGL